MSKTSMTAIALGAFGAALFASAAPLNATTFGSAEVSNIDQVDPVCNEYYGRCWRRYYYDPSYFPGRGYKLAPASTITCYGGPRFTIRAW